MGWLSRLRGGRDQGARAQEADVVVLSRAGCHLCAEMEQVIAGVLAERPGRSGRPGRLRVVDLDELAQEDPTVLDRWTTKVPVLLVDGAEVAHWRADAATVRAALRR